MRSILFAISAMALGCVSCVSYEPVTYEPLSTDRSALESAGIIVYQSGQAVPESELVPLNPADFGGTITEGDVQWLGRVDYLDQVGGIGGIFHATHGKFNVLYPGTSHGTVHKGTVILTDELGSHHLGVGDTFVARQGTLVEWEIPGPMVQFSFIARPEGVDSAGPILIYKKGSVASDSELGYLGSFADFNAEVLEGDPQVSARIDHTGGTAFSGILQITPGLIQVSSTDATEHGTVLRHGINLTTEDGTTYSLKAGDSFLQYEGTKLLLEIPNPRMQWTTYAFRQQ